MISIQSIYIALFGRPADPGGLEYWTQQTNGGTDLSFLIGRLTDSPEYKARVENLTPEQVISSIYQSLFGRQPDSEGLEFYRSLLEGGGSGIETIAIDILAGSQGPDAVVVDNRVAAANLFTESLDTPEEIAAYVGDSAADIARQLIQGVNADPATIPTQEEIEEVIEHVETGEPPTPPVEPPVTPNPPVTPDPEPAKFLSRNAEVSTVAQDEDSGNIWVGSGNPADRFSVLQVDFEDDKAPDIELALGVQYRNGEGPAGQDGVITDGGDGVYTFIPGEDVMFRYSVSSLIESVELADLLVDYDVSLFVDNDSAIGVTNFVRLNLESEGGLSGTRVNNETDTDTYSGLRWDFPDYSVHHLTDDIGNPSSGSVTQNIQAVQWYAENNGELFSSGRALGAGEYDIALRLYDKSDGSLIAENVITLVGTAPQAPEILPE